jgi:hypothetical protein
MNWLVKYGLKEVPQWFFNRLLFRLTDHRISAQQKASTLLAMRSDSSQRVKLKQ